VDGLLEPYLCSHHDHRMRCTRATVNLAPQARVRTSSSLRWTLPSWMLSGCLPDAEPFRNVPSCRTSVSQASGMGYAKKLIQYMII
jgi:hypothetical protein